MSSLTVLCPNGHRQKVSTTPNMSLLQVLETTCKKKGFDSSKHKLTHRDKNLDLSLSVRFSGIPNNCLLEMVELQEDELSKAKNSQITVCLQIPSGERLIGEFSSSDKLEQVLTRWNDKLGVPEEGEEPVLVYMRNEIVGTEALESTTFRILGLSSGKGLFRFCYKKPEVLKDQAKVYAIKQAEKSEPKSEPRHLPMRLEPTTLKEVLPESDSSSSAAAAAVGQPADGQVNRDTEKDEPQSEAAPEPAPSTSKEIRSSTDEREVPDSTSQEEEAVIELVGPHEAVIFSGEESSSRSMELCDEDFELSLEEVKARYKELKLAVKSAEDGGQLMTKAMRETQEEGEKLSLLGRYKSGVLRVQFPNRLTVQGIFSPATTIGEVMHWLQPLLEQPDVPFELYIAPPRTVLDEKSTLLELNLFPAALIHFSSKLTTSADPQLQTFIKPEFTASLSNIQGANTVAGQHRKGGKRRQTGLSGELPAQSAAKPESIPESRSGKRSGESVSRPDQPKLPKWFKPGK